MPKPHILLIEDTDSVREVITRQLQVLGAEVTALADGDRVKRELDKTPFDLVIADLHLPDCSGIDIARFAKAKNCKIILLSGDTNLISRPSILSAGFDDILEKPVTLEGLQKILEKFKLGVHGVSAKTPEQEYDETGSIHLTSLYDQMGDLDETCRVMLSRFPDMMRPLVDKILTGAQQKDFKLTEETAHSLKGAARSIGAIKLGEICNLIQEDATKNRVNDADLKNLNDEFLLVTKGIETLCK